MLVAYKHARDLCNFVLFASVVLKYIKSFGTQHVLPLNFILKILCYTNIFVRKIIYYTLFTQNLSF
jgi:hypothetical protein